MEMQSIEFHKSVAEGYRKLAESFPDRIKTVDATLPIDEICGMIRSRVKALLDA